MMLLSGPFDIAQLLFFLQPEAALHDEAAQGSEDDVFRAGKRPFAHRFFNVPASWSGN